MAGAPLMGAIADRLACGRRLGIDRRTACIFLGSTIASYVFPGNAAPADELSRPIFKTPTIPAVDLPAFQPAIPHQPSARTTFKPKVLAGYRNRPARELMSTIENTLLDLNYPEVYHFAYPTGMVLMLPFEQLSDDRSFIFDIRFDVESNGRPKGDADGVFAKRTGLVRTVAFFLTTGQLRMSKHPTKFAKQYERVLQGGKSLDPDLVTPMVTADHELRAFVYEWRTHRNTDPEFLRLSPLLGREHMSKIGIEFD
jgi:hypothetical protein